MQLIITNLTNSVDAVYLTKMHINSKIAKKLTGTLPCCTLGAQLPPGPPPLFLSFLFFLILAPAGGSNHAGT